MSESSQKDNHAFEAISLKQVSILVQLLRGSTHREINYISSRYNEQARYFDETVSFLRAIRMVKEKNGDLLLLKDVNGHPPSPHNFLEKSLIDAIYSTQNSYQEGASNFLLQFQLTDGEFVHRPIGESHLFYSGVRNFLMELEVVSFDPKSGNYLISPEYFDLYLTVKSKCGVVSVNRLKKQIRDQNDIGLVAEKAVMSFEKKRLPGLSKPIVHVALTNTAAGYDIKSFSSDSHEYLHPRYIEVKAVSPTTKEFHWTSNEVRIAELLGKFYCLYLVPICQHRRVDIGNLIIIENPYENVYKCSDQWLIEEDVILCKQRL